MTLKKLLTGAAVAGLLVGCTVTVGPGGDGGNNDSGSNEAGGGDGGKTDGGGGDGGGSCPAIGTLVTFAPPAACDTCMGSKCCMEVTTCYSDKGDAGSDTCVDYDDCVNPCASLMGMAQQQCVAACDATHPNSKAKWNAVATCLTGKCNTECP